MFEAFRAFKNRNYALYFSGQIASMVGTWMQGTAQAWLIYQLTQSSVWLGVITFCTQVPSFFTSPIAGVMADSTDRKRTLLITQFVALTQALILSLLVFTSHVQIWHIAVLSVVLGISNGFEVTTRHSFIVDLVGKEDLPSAIALNSLIFNASRMIGPALAGAVVVLFGEGVCFAINAASYLAVILALLLVRTHHKTSPLEIGSSLDHLKDGWRYAQETHPIRTLILFGVFVSLVALSYIVFLPVIAKDILHGDARTLGWLTAAHGFGAVFGGLSSANVRSFEGSRKKIILMILLVGVFLIFLGTAKSYILLLLALFGIGFFMMSIYPTINSTLQLIVRDSMRGRVLSLYTMSFQGAAPIGALLAGFLAKVYGVSTVLISAGIICMAVFLLLRPRAGLSRVS